MAKNDKKANSTLYIVIILMMVVLVVNYFVANPIFDKKMSALNNTKSQIELKDKTYRIVVQSNSDFVAKAAEKVAELKQLQDATKPIDDLTMITTLSIAASTNGVTIVNNSPQAFGDEVKDKTSGVRYTMKLSGTYLGLNNFIQWIEQYNGATLIMESMSIKNMPDRSFNADLVVAQYSFK